MGLRACADALDLDMAGAMRMAHWQLSRKKFYRQGHNALFMRFYSDIARKPA
jgi:hypothetical protein